jgi:uncharacterized protein YbaP (TraB family)
MQSPYWFRRLAAVACAFALFSSAPAWAKPALWLVRGPTARVYLFGTIHALPPGTDWHSATLDHAFGDAHDVWLEVADAGDKAAMGPLMQRFGADPGHPLTSKLTQDRIDRLEAVLRRSTGGGEAGVDGLRPWVAALVVALAPLRAAGLNPDSGADVDLKAAAVAAGKPVHGLETAEQQLRIFADLPPRAEIALLDEALDDADAGPAKLAQMLAAWIAGDVATLARLTHEESDGPQWHDLDRAIFHDRNAAWAEQIATLLNGSGTVFIAVGAGHLVGPDNVQQMLVAKGFKVERVQ